ncbi:MAG: DoxX family protein, partial [Chitinophagaceae bacterium]
VGFLIMYNHGLMKLEHFSEIAPRFANPLHIGSYLSFLLVLFAEIICGPLLVLGLFTRWASIPLIIEMLVLIFMVENQHGLSGVELPLHLLIGFIVVLILGPGKISLDGLISRR